jgi:hypothetical protein
MENACSKVLTYILTDIKNSPNSRPLYRRPQIKLLLLTDFSHPDASSPPDEPSSLTAWIHKEAGGGGEGGQEPGFQNCVT